MEGFDAHPGTVKLALALSRRMKKENESPLALDFGEIQANSSLVTNTFPVPIPKGDYSVCGHVRGAQIQADGGSHEGHSGGDGSHTHTVSLPAVKAGDRVLVAWVQSEAVVIDVITKS
jgi:hypothetical protein